MTRDDAKKIWAYLQRFPHYDDLKELNNKFLPELASVQLQVMKFQVEIEKLQLII